VSGSIIPAHRKPPGQAHGHRRHDANIIPLAAMPPAPPRCPAGLLAGTRRRWDAFWASPSAHAVDPDADLGRLERWIRQVDEYERVRRVVISARLVTGSMGQPVLNPLWAALAQLETQIAKAEDHFGMTPMSRLRLGITAAAGGVAAERARSAAIRATVTADDDDDRRAQVLGISRERQP
jgi:P27 family predicted phage terminase small subunit